MAAKSFKKIYDKQALKALKKIKSAKTQLLFFELALHFDVSRALPTNQIIATKLGINPTTIPHHMATLFKAGLLIKKGNVRWFNLDIVTQKSEEVTNRLKYSDEITRKAHEDALERRSSQNDPIG